MRQRESNDTKEDSLTVQEENSMASIESTPLVSIVIPVFNTPVEHFRRMLESVVCQTYRNLEIIVVDDGSEEENARAYEEICADDDRITMLHKGNGGVSSARNLGKRSSHGLYSMFVDSDDELIQTCIEQALDLALEHNLDVVYGGVEYVSSGAVRRSQVEFSDRDYPYVLSDDEIELLADYFMSYARISRLPQIKNLSRGPHAKLYATRLISDIEFDTAFSLREDGIFNAIVLAGADRVGVVNEVWHRYHQHGYSVVNNLRLDGRIISHAQALSGYFNGETHRDNNMYAQITTLFFETLSNESRRRFRGRLRRIRKTLKNPLYAEAFSRVRLDEYVVSRKRRINYWLCKKRLSLPVYLYYSLRAAGQRARGESPKDGA